MSKLLLSGLSTSIQPTDNVLYSDLYLGPRVNGINNIGGLQAPNIDNDVRALYNLESVRNALVNLFSTMPGEKILTPNFGLNLKKYLFDPVNNDIAREMGIEILTAVRKWEPRVIVKNINVKPLPDEHEYRVNFVYAYRDFLNAAPATLNGLVSVNGFRVI